VNEPVYRLDDDFWEQVIEPYRSELISARDNSSQTLKENFLCTDEEIDEFVDQLEVNIYTFTTDYIKKIFRDINSNLLRKFSLVFKKEDGVKNRDWRSMEEQ